MKKNKNNMVFLAGKRACDRWKIFAATFERSPNHCNVGKHGI